MNAATFCAGSLALVAFLFTACSADPLDSALRFKPDGTFKVVQLTDLHLGESPDKDAASLRVRLLMPIRMFAWHCVGRERFWTLRTLLAR
jgi:hypothetical protein